ncbi:MAG TPA: glucuronate isomerase [Clostridiaceae bacterium]|nr:glucuronate isomerase [Clostridiaceae bacterium]
MGRENLKEIMYNMDIVDTHCHLEHDNITARDFWTIAEYFWLARQLWAAGYPQNASELDEKTRVNEFCKAYHNSKNTVWCWALDRIFKDLYSITLSDEKSVYDAIEAVRNSKEDPKWAETVALKTKLKKAVVNAQEHKEFQGLPGVCVTVPRIDGKIKTWATRISDAENKLNEAEMVAQEIEQLVEYYKKNGRKGIMTTIPRFEKYTNVNPDEIITKNSGFGDALIFVLHRLCSEIEKQEMFLQFFLGVESNYCSQAVPSNDPERVTKLYGLFERYNCPFDIVLATKINNIDAIWAANIFPNVYVGAMWWYNYLPELYRETLKYRLEAVPMVKSSIIATDARCLEWTYGKALVVKKVLAEFLAEQVEQGWIDEDTALLTARYWLYEVPLNLFV